jgi:hypothetical protein
LVRALVRGEEDRILDLTIGDLEGAHELAIELLVSEVDGAVHADPSSDAIVVTNSYQAHALMSGLPGIGTEGPRVGLQSGTQIVRVYDDRTPYVALLSPKGLPRVQVSTPPPQVEGDEPLLEQHALIGVSELPADEMDRIVAEKERSPLEEARLRGSVRVRLLEHLEISMEESRAPQLWRLPADSW